jgi:hypothetical protein
MSFDPQKPYNDLPLLPPKQDIETSNILRKTITAGRALADGKDTTNSRNVPFLQPIFL